MPLYDEQLETGTPVPLNGNPAAPRQPLEENGWCSYLSNFVGPITGEKQGRLLTLTP